MGRGCTGGVTEGVGGKRWRDWEGDGVRSCKTCMCLLTYLHTYIHSVVGLRGGGGVEGEEMGWHGMGRALGWGMYIDEVEDREMGMELRL